MSEPTPDLVLDSTIWPVLVDLVGCLCSELRKSGLPETCFCGIMPGNQTPFDVAEEDKGVAWVRTANIFPSSNFPALDNSGRACSAPLAVQIEVGAMFCYPAAMLTEPISTSDAWDAARMQHAAMAAMYRAIQCCAGSKRGSLLTIGQYLPQGPDGGLVGGTWQVWARDWR